MTEWPPYSGPPNSAPPPSNYPQPNPYAQAPYPYQPGAYPYQQSPYGYAPVPPGQQRPGVLTAAAVLGYVAGGLLILAGFLLFFGASVLNDVEDSANTHTSYAAELAVAGVGNLLAAGLLIAGAVSMTGRNANGRPMYLLGAAIVAIATVYWLARWATRTGGQPVVVYALLFAALVVVGVALAFTRDATTWLGGKPRT